MSLGFGVLGPLKVWGDQEIEVERPSQRRLLSSLLFDAGRRIETSVLIDRLWGDDPPATAKGALQTHISALRKVLPSDVIVTEGYGYRLDIDGHHFDVVEFTSQASTAQQMARSRDWELVLRATDVALELWRGRPYQELADEFAMPERTRLEELRLELLEARAEALLGLGHHEEALPQLERLVIEHPLRERLWEHLVTARYRSGRHAEAIRAYREAEEALAEVGLEPGRRLRELEEKVFLQDSALSGPSNKHNLPSQLTSFIGREQELADLDKLLADNRLVTLTGVGGSGKSRLAVEAAAGAVETFPDGCWVVELAGISDPDLIAGEVATAIGLRPRTTDTLDVLTSAVGDQCLLIVLDNCERLLAPVASLTRSLLQAGPEVKILATSREPLGVAGELVYEVPPMNTPNVPPDDVDRLREYDAIKLFEDRAALKWPGFALDSGNKSSVIEICRGLDGIPLAIELAAALVNSLGTRSIADRLSDRFQLLTMGTRSAPPRQRTLEAMVEWSYGLLDDQERTLFERLSVFAGTFDLETAEQVCVDDALHVDDLVGLMSNLINKSLMVTRETGAGLRYSMLDTIRHYAADRLEETETSERLRRRHAEAFADLASDFYDRWRTPDQMEVSRRFELELDNFRVALEWAESKAPELMLRTTGSLLPLWAHRGLLGEGFSWLTRSPMGESGLPAELRARTLMESAVYTVSASPDVSLETALSAIEAAREVDGNEALLARAMAWGEWVRWYMDNDFTTPSHEAIEVAMRSGDRSSWAITKMVIGLIEGDIGLATGLELLTESVALFHTLGDRIHEAWALWWLADAAEHVGRLEDCVRWCDQAIALAKATVSRVVEIHVTALKGDALQLLGDEATARELLSESMEGLEMIGDLWCVALRHHNLACLDVDADESKAIEHLEAAISMSRQIDMPFVTERCGSEIARLATRRGDFDTAIELFAANDASVRSRLPDVDTELFRMRVLESQREPEYTQARENVSSEVWETAWSRGAAMSADEVAAKSLAWMAMRNPGLD